MKKLLLLTLLVGFISCGGGTKKTKKTKTLNQYQTELMGKSKKSIRTILGKPESVIERSSGDMWTYNRLVLESSSGTECDLILTFNDLNRSNLSEKIVGQINKRFCR
tara:strand:- start:223 stop:543 length:321 start_codon:yes stop_codon:yes gene_type:complete